MYSFNHKSKRLISGEQIAQSLYISGDPDELLNRLSKGDKAALIQLVLLQLQDVIFYAERFSHKSLTTTDLVTRAINNAVINYIEEQAKILSVAGKVDSRWLDVIPGRILESMNNISKKTRITNASKNCTPKRIVFLNNLNHILRELEAQLIQRVTEYLYTGEAKLRGKDPFTVDYTVELEILYYVPHLDGPVYTHNEIFNYKRAIIDNDYGMLLYTDERPDPHREGNMPELNEPYCYLLHALIDHSWIGNKLYDINHIWADFIYKDQKGIKVSRNGNCRKLRFHKKKNRFV